MTRHERRAMWHTHVKQQRDSNESAASYCRTHNLCLPSFYAWRKRLSGDGPESAFVEVRCQESVPQQALTLTRSSDGQWQLQLSGPVNAMALAMVVQALETALSQPCSQS